MQRGARKKKDEREETEDNDGVSDSSWTKAAKQPTEEQVRTLVGLTMKIAILQTLKNH